MIVKFRPVIPGPSQARSQEAITTGQGDMASGLPCAAPRNDRDRNVMTQQIGGRIFFSNTGRTFGEEDELCVLSVGVDIGSSTSHLVFSRIVLERLDSRYVVTERESFYQSEILVTPYA